MQSFPIAIAAAGGCTPEFPSLEGLWDAWLANRPAPLRILAPHEEDAAWTALTTAATAAVASPPSPPAACGLILGTTKGRMARQETWMAAASNALPLPPLPQPPCLDEAAAELAASHRRRGPVYAVSTACSSGLMAIIEAALLVRQGAAPEMLACGADIVGGFVRDGFGALKAATRTACRPFDRRRDGLILGSAAAACRLAARGPVQLVGFGAASDATHMTAPDRAAGGLIRTITQALAMAGIAPGQIDAIIAHGTGTRYNDAMEALAFETVFGPHRPAVTGVKGLIGHTLGASGLIETALACRMLESQIVPPVVGLEEPEYPALNLVLGAPRPMPLRYVLKTASGFGGGNAALILRRTPAEDRP